jgi:peroxiredoxin
MNRREFLTTAAAAAPLLRAATLPRPAIWKSYPAPDGQKIDLAAYKGKVIALEFLLTTCPSCQRCAQTVQRMYNEFGPKGFQAVGLAVNPNANVLVPKFAADYGIAFPIGWATEPEYREYLEMSVMTRATFPQLLFIDKKGMIRAQFSGSDPFFHEEDKSMRAQISSLLSETGTVSKPGRSKKG